MKALIRSRFTWLSVLVAAVLGSALAVAPLLDENTTAEDLFNWDLYDSYLALRVNSEAGILADYGWRQVMYMPLLLPDPDHVLFQDGGVLPVLDWSRFSDAFIKGLVPVVRDGMTTYPVWVMEDAGVNPRCRVILNANDEVIAELPVSKDYDPAWWVKEHYPELYGPLASVAERDYRAYLESLFDGSRLAMDYELIDHDNLLNLVLNQSIEAALQEEEEGGGMVMMDWGGGSVTNIQFVEIARVDTNGTMSVTVAYPDDFKNRISLIACTNLLVQDWSLLVTTNPPTTTNTFTYVDTAAANYDIRFYHAYNADYDGDGDGVSDGAERFRIGSDPDDADSDDDGMGDGAELAHGFDPTVSNTFASLPYTEDFESMDEGALHEQDEWVCAPTNSVVVQTNEVNRGSQAAEFLESTNTLTADQFIAAQGETNVWIDFRAKIDPRAVTYFDDHPDGNDAPAYEPCVFAVNRRGEVWAYDGAQEAWTNDARFILTEYQWHRFTVRENYNGHTWDLFVDSIRVFSGIGFRKWIEPYASNTVSITEFSRFSLAAARGGGWYVDDISVGATQPEGLCGELQTTNIRVSASSDDADEDDGNGAMNLTRGKLELAVEIVGLRFRALPMTGNAIPAKTYVEFVSQDDLQEYSSIRIECESTNDASVFVDQQYNISLRATTEHSVTWTPPGWADAQTGFRQRTPDLSALIHEVIGLDGWQSGNNIVFIFRDTGSTKKREAESRDDGSAVAPLLHMEWSEPLP